MPVMTTLRIGFAPLDLVDLLNDIADSAYVGKIVVAEHHLECLLDVADDEDLVERIDVEVRRQIEIRRDRDGSGSSSLPSSSLMISIIFSRCPLYHPPSL